MNIHLCSHIKYKLHYIIDKHFAVNLKMNQKREEGNANVAIKPNVLEEYSSDDDEEVGIENLAGDKTIVFASHVEDETNYKGAINYVGKWRGNVDIPVGTVVAVNAHHLDSHRWKSIEQKCFFTPQ